MKGAMTTTDDRELYTHFRQNPLVFTARRALELARGAQWARDKGIRFEWERDRGPWGCRDLGELDEHRVCIARNARGAIVATRDGIPILPGLDVFIRRIVEAEFAKELARTEATGCRF
jgi:hypothetical protein